jgi:hypothetical protein
VAEATEESAQDTVLRIRLLWHPIGALKPCPRSAKYHHACVSLCERALGFALAAGPGALRTVGQQHSEDKVPYMPERRPVEKRRLAKPPPTVDAYEGCVNREKVITHTAVSMPS